MVFGMDEVERLRAHHSIEMSNLELARERYEYIKRVLPDVVMIEDGIHQHFIRTHDGMERLRRKIEYLAYQQTRLEKELTGKKHALRQLRALTWEKPKVEEQRQLLQRLIDKALDEMNVLKAFETDVKEVALLVSMQTATLALDIKAWSVEMSALPKDGVKNG